MAQYKTGTVSVTNDNATVTGSGTAFSANLTAGNLFTVEGDNVAYTIASAPTATSLTLTAPYGGTTGSGKIYGVTIDFTPDMGLPLMSIGDLNTAAIYNEAMKNIDNLNLDDLGTAAFADLTTSETDTTAGRVLRVGDAGLLKTTNNAISDLYALRPSGMYAVNSSTANKPVGFTNGALWVGRWTAASAQAMILVDVTGYNTYFVRYNGVSWSSYKIWHSENTIVDINGFIKEL